MQKPLQAKFLGVRFAEAESAYSSCYSSDKLDEPLYRADKVYAFEGEDRISDNPTDWCAGHITNERGDTFWHHIDQAERKLYSIRLVFEVRIP